MAGGRPHVPLHCAVGLADRVRRPDPWPSEGHALSAPGALPREGMLLQTDGSRHD